VRVLLDESLPRPFAALLSGHEVQTIAAVGWSGKENGELLRPAAGRFDVLLTADMNLEHEQNLTALPISVVVLVGPTNRLESLAPLVPELLELLKAPPSPPLGKIGGLTLGVSGAALSKDRSPTVTAPARRRC